MRTDTGRPVRQLCFRAGRCLGIRSEMGRELRWKKQTAELQCEQKAGTGVWAVQRDSGSFNWSGHRHTPSRRRGMKWQLLWLGIMVDTSSASGKTRACQATRRRSTCKIHGNVCPLETWFFVIVTGVYGRILITYCLCQLRCCSLACNHSVRWHWSLRAVVLNPPHTATV